MLERLSPVWRRWALLALFALVLWFAWTVRAVLNPIILAYLLAFVLHPLVLRLERRGWSRRTAVNVIFVASGLLSLLVALAVFWQAKDLWIELSKDNGVLDQIDKRAGEGLAQLEKRLEGWGVELPWKSEASVPITVEPGAPSDEGRDVEQSASHTLGMGDLFQRVRAWLAEEGHLAGAGQAGMQAAGGVLVFLRALFGSLISVVTFVFLLPIYTYFLMFELERIHSFVRRYLPRRERARIVRIVEQIGEVLSSFFRGRLLVCLAKGLLLAAGLWLVDVPYALLLGLLSGALSLIPILGPALGFALAFLLGLLKLELLAALWRVGLVFAVGEAIEGYVLMPRILGQSLGLHPMVVLASLMIGGAALGMFGLLMALPLAATVIILVRELVLPALQQEADDESSGRIVKR